MDTWTWHWNNRKNMVPMDFSRQNMEIALSGGIMVSLSFVWSAPPFGLENWFRASSALPWSYYMFSAYSIVLYVSTQKKRWQLAGRINMMGIMYPVGLWPTYKSSRPTSIKDIPSNQPRTETGTGVLADSSYSFLNWKVFIGDHFPPNKSIEFYK